MPKTKFKTHQLAFIGAGYVGLVSGTALAEIGHQVILVDNNPEKIAKLKKGVIPIYEPGLARLVAKNVKAKRLSFTTNLKQAVNSSEVVFIAVNTPPLPSGKADLSYVAAAAHDIAKVADSYKVIVDKSTVPVQTGERVAHTIKQYMRRGRRRQQNIDFDVVSNPEFLREGTAIKDFLEPDRIVVGVSNQRAEKIMREIYAPIKAPFIVTDVKSAELIKHASNSFLAMKISFINALARLCELSGANIDQVAYGMGTDSRINTHFLNAGIGYGGSCFEASTTTYTLNSPYLKTKSFQQLFASQTAHPKKHAQGSASATIPSHSQTLSFDLKNNQTQLQPIKIITKRLYTGPFMTFKTKLGRTLRVTADHPVVTFDEHTNNFNILPAIKVKTGDYLTLALGSVSLVNPPPIKLLPNLTRHQLGQDIWLRPHDRSFSQISPSLLRAIPSRIMKYPLEVRRTNCLPLKAYQLLRSNNYLPETNERELLAFTTKGTPTYCPVSIELTDQFIRLLGYYLAEGWISNDTGRNGKVRDRISLAFHKKETEYINDVHQTLASLGIRHATRTTNQVTCLSISSRPFAYILRDILQLGTNSNNKQLPPFAFNLPANGRFALLQGLFSGDGSITAVNQKQNLYFEYTTTSKILADGVVLLLQSLHIVPAIQEKWMNKSTRPAYHVRINGLRQLKRLRLLFGRQRQKQIDRIISRYQRSIAPTGFKRRKNIAAVAITNTHLEPQYQGDVYSMETGNGLFVGAGGLIVHNCFPKDVSAFITIADELGYDFGLLREVEKINRQARALFLQKIEQALWVTKGKTIAVWGLSFKPNTDDMRNAPSVPIIEQLHADGAVIQAYDPQATHTAKVELGNKVTYCANQYDALKNADALVIITDWDEFKKPNWRKVSALLKNPIIIDGRNMFDPKEMDKKGFVYHSVGRG